MPSTTSPPKSALPPLIPRRKQQPVSPLPLPSIPDLPPPLSPSSKHTYVIPTRRILTPHDHTLFLNSPTHTLLQSFIFTLSLSVRDTPISTIASASQPPIITNLLSTLTHVDETITLYPPEDTGSRFGNASFRSFLDCIERECAQWHEELGVPKEAIPELSTYFLQSFGNRTRIDYGSGHELNFCVWLLCLYQLNLVPRTSFPALVLVVFYRYLTLMRRIQATYYLEPAGSHGVWGLDDYQFLPFLWGASQLLHHPFIRPLAIHQSTILEEYGDEYLYLNQVNFVNGVKNVEGLRWHSPMLDDISAAKNWDKVECGMRRMFVAEVLGKLPVMQHFLFGSLVQAVEGMSREEEVGAKAEKDEGEGGEVVVMKDGMRHVHQMNSWGDCCGIKVPSSVAAAQEMKKRMGGGEGLRRIPFD